MTTPTLTREICGHFIKQQLFQPSSISKAAALPGTVGLIGVELEAIPYLRLVHDEKAARPVSLYGGQNSVMDALLKVSAQYGGVAKHWYPGAQYNGYSAQIESIDFPDGDRFLFEPGGQVEISTAPYTTLEALQYHLADKQAVLDLVTQQTNIHFAQFGINPWWSVDVPGNQLHKPRYHALENYLNSIGPHGKQMMFQTCALHINMDIGAESETRAKRIIAANLIAPFATALFANSAVSEGRANGHKSYRSFLWQHLDDTRTGILPLDRLANKVDEAALIDLYLDFVLKAPLIYISEFGERVLPAHMTLEHWMKHPIDGLSPGIPHLANHVTLLFPELRLKGYLEIRSVDAPPPKWQLIPVMFYTGLLYCEAQLDKALELLLPLTSRMKELHALATLGLQSDDIFGTSKELIRLAIEGFSGLPAYFKEEYHTQQMIGFFERFTSRRKTFADEQLDALE